MHSFPNSFLCVCGGGAEKALESQIKEEQLLLIAEENNMSGIQSMKKGHSNKDE